MDDTLNIEKFDPTAAQLHELVALPVDLTDPLNEDSVKAAHEKRMKLREARVAITKTGKAMREDALKFQKDVIAKEKELVAIVEPEEARLQEFEDKAAVLKEREARKAALPMRREQLRDIDPEAEKTTTDEAILDMDATGFKEHLNQVLAAKNKREADALAAQKAEQDARQAELDRKEREAAEKEAREKAAAEAAEKARAEERARIEREAAEKAEREKREAEAKAKAEAEAAAKLAADQKYQAFLTEHNYTPERAYLYRIERTDKKVFLFEKVGELDLV